MYDIERALQEIARSRSRRDGVTRETKALAERIAAGFRGDFDGVLDLDTCGRALVIAAGSLVPLCGPDIPATVIVNMIAFAGESLVREEQRSEVAE